MTPPDKDRTAVLLATDSFKGCLSSSEAEEAFAEALAQRGIASKCIPMSDGGEGMLEAFSRALGAVTHTLQVHDPLMRPVAAAIATTPDGTAIIETAKACGLCLLRHDELNPLEATTYGVGELVAAAWKTFGCRRFIIGLGGSGTSDAGRGMIKALEEHFPEGLPKGGVFTLASDVRNPLCGEDGAAHVFGPQKGASPGDVAELDRRAAEFARQSAALTGRDASMNPGAGAAGGLGYAFMQYLDAQAVPGADLLLGLTDFDEAARHSALVITGEGRSDRQTLMGKLPQRVLLRARRAGRPVWLVSGRIEDRPLLEQAGFSGIWSITPEDMPLGQAVQPQTAVSNIRRWADSTLQPGCNIRSLYLHR